MSCCRCGPTKGGNFCPTSASARCPDTGDFSKFASQFRALAEQTMTSDLAQLAEVVRSTPTALLCCEREYAECHRSIVADLLARQLNATVVAV